MSAAQAPFAILSCGSMQAAKGQEEANAHGQDNEVSVAAQERQMSKHSSQQCGCHWQSNVCSTGFFCHPELRHPAVS